MHICIVGSGPAGFYAAGFLLANSDARIDMVERLPNPFGLVRAGIAPDHQHTKAVSGLFEKIAQNQRFRFLGNITVGTTVDLSALRAHYDAVVLAIGAMGDRRLGVPGEQLSGCLSATEFVGWYNGHPDYADLEPDLNGGPVVVIGNGNVAADVARVIMSPPDLLERTDIADHALAKIRRAAVQSVHVVGRKAARDARFTPPELKQLGKIPGVSAWIDERDLGTEGSETGQLHALFRSFVQLPAESGKQIRFHFHLVPEIVLGLSHVTGVAFRDTRTGELVKIRANLVIKSIGNVGTPTLDLPFDTARQKIENVDGRVCEAGQLLPNLYVAGWAKRGATGTVGTNKLDTEATCRLLLSDVSSVARTRKDPDELVSRIRSRGVKPVSFAEWKRIDQAEVEAGRALRPRRKFVRVGEMLDIVQGGATRPQSVRGS